MRLTPIHRKEFIKRLKKLGWKGPFVGTKYEIFIKGYRKVPIPNPHGSGEISVPKLKELLNEMGIERNEWINAK